MDGSYERRRYKTINDVCTDCLVDRIYKLSEFYCMNDIGTINFSVIV